MNKSILIIPNNKKSLDLISVGYKNVLEYLGYNVYYENPSNKRDIINLIEKYNVDIIFSGSQNGVFQLPVNTINKNKVKIIFKIFPIDQNLLHIEEEIIKSIEYIYLWSEIKEHTNERINYLPLAGNLLYTASILKKENDILLSNNFENDKETIDKWISPITKRFKITNNTIILMNTDNYPQNLFLSCYLFINLHNQDDKTKNIYLDTNTFDSLLWGCYQLNDIELSKDLMNENIIYFSTQYNLISLCESLLKDKDKLIDNIIKSSSFIAQNHTYFNRLNIVFKYFDMIDICNQCMEKHDIVVTKHKWLLKNNMNTQKEFVHV